MHPLVPYIWTAGAIHLLLVAANAFLPSTLRCRDALRQGPPIVRQIFIVHWAYIAALLVGFSVLCFRFAPELAGGNSLGRFLSGSLAIFWLVRIPVQLLYYDSSIRRQHRLGDLMFTVAIGFLAGVFAIAASGVVT